MKQEEEFSELRQLLRRKGLEQPPAEYFERFLSEFQHRQRAELLQRSAHGIFFERMATYFSGLGGHGGHRWAYGAGLAYAAVMLALFALPDRAAAPAIAAESGEGESILWDGDVSLVQPARFAGDGSGGSLGTPSSMFLLPASASDGGGDGPRQRRPVLPAGEVFRTLSNSSVVPTATEL